MHTFYFRSELHQNQRRLHAQRQDRIGKEGKKKGKKEGGMGRVMDHEAEWEERTEEGLGKEGEAKSAYRFNQ